MVRSTDVGAEPIAIGSARLSIVVNWLVLAAKGGGLAGLLLGVLAACVSFRTSGAETIADWQAEENYKAVYARQMAVLETDNKLFEASGSNPGVCNAGGNKQACYDADAQAIRDLTAMIAAFEAAEVPPRFAEADRQLREALGVQLEGLRVRNQALVNRDDAAWARHRELLEQGAAQFLVAYEAFPPDNRPLPAPKLVDRELASTSPR